VVSSGPSPHNPESAKGADTSPEGDPSRRRGQSRESGDASGRELELAAAIRGRNFPRLPDEGHPEFTKVTANYIYTGRLSAPVSVSYNAVVKLSQMTTSHGKLSGIKMLQVFTPDI